MLVIATLHCRENQVSVLLDALQLQATALACGIARIALQSSSTLTCIPAGLPAPATQCVLPAPAQLVNCGLSPATVAKLEEKGITALFPIQKHVFEPVMAGRDLIGRARTGSGKTLAFALPVIENLVKVGSWLLDSTPQCANPLM